jgi:hypothetical protein
VSLSLITSQHTERPGAAVSVAIGRLVADGTGYRLSGSGIEAAIVVADGTGYGIATSGTRAAHLLLAGDSYQLSPL